MEIIVLPIIVSVVYLLMAVYKQSIARGRENYLRVIPIISMVCGALLGVVIYFAMPELLPIKNIFMAIVIGAASGLAATGTHQVFKQMQGDKMHLPMQTPDDEPKDEPDDQPKK